IPFDDQSRRLSGFGSRVGALRLPIDLQQISATLGPLALREHFLDFLFRIVLYWHLDLARRHSPLLLGHVLWGRSSVCSGCGHRPPVLSARSGTLRGAALSTTSGDFERQVEIPRGAGSQL